jgi:hypothetical protein
MRIIVADKSIIRQQRLRYFLVNCQVEQCSVWVKDVATAMNEITKIVN